MKPAKSSNGIPNNNLFHSFAEYTPSLGSYFCCYERLATVSLTTDEILIHGKMYILIFKNISFSKNPLVSHFNDRHQILLLMLSGFERINQVLLLLKSSENLSF